MGGHWMNDFSPAKSCHFRFLVGIYWSTCQHLVVFKSETATCLFSELHVCVLISGYWRTLIFFLSEDKSSMKQLLATATPLGEPEAFKLARVAVFVISELGTIQRDSLGRHGHVLRSLQPLSSAAQLWKRWSPVSSSVRCGHPLRGGWK